MVSVRYLFAAIAAIIVSTTAHAADMPLPAPQIVYQQAPCCDTGRWYLRGDVGVGVQSFQSFDHSQTNSVFVWPASWTIVQQDIQDSAIFGMGIGYAWNSWLRFVRVGLRWMFPAGGGFGGGFGGFGGFAGGGPVFAPAAAAQYVPAPAPQYAPAPPPQYMPAPAPQYYQPPLSSRG